MKYLSILLLLISFHVSAQDTLISPTNCAEFIQDIDFKQDNIRNKIQLINCKQHPQYGLEALEATYHIQGENILEVENWLVENTKLGRLKFVCCGWESYPWGGLISQKNRHYEVTLYGDAFDYKNSTWNNQRENLKDIPYFILSVKHYLEEP